MSPIPCTDSGVSFTPISVLNFRQTEAHPSVGESIKDRVYKIIRLLLRVCSCRKTSKVSNKVSPILGGELNRSDPRLVGNCKWHSGPSPVNWTGSDTREYGCWPYYCRRYIPRTLLMDSTIGNFGHRVSFTSTFERKGWSKSKIDQRKRYGEETDETFCGKSVDIVTKSVLPDKSDPEGPPVTSFWLLRPETPGMTKVVSSVSSGRK